MGVPLERSLLQVPEPAANGCVDFVPGGADDEEVVPVAVHRDLQRVSGARLHEVVVGPVLEHVLKPLTLARALEPRDGGHELPRPLLGRTGPLAPPLDFCYLTDAV